MIGKEQIARDINRSAEHLIETITNFPEDKFNLKPAPGAWSAGEVAEHLIIIGKGESRILSKPARSIAERNPTEKIEEMKPMAYDFTNKVVAAERVLPTGNPINKADAIQQIRDNTKAILDVLAMEDMTLMTDIPNRLFGELTRIEWIYFAIYHCERHIKQMERIKEALQ
jgi:hypothetical protein